VYTVKIKTSTEQLNQSCSVDVPLLLSYNGLRQLTEIDKMKTIKATGKYAVSFNTCFGDYEVGESDMNSIDYAGDDIDVLASETIKDDPSFPMVFERVTDHRSVIGVFRDAKDLDCVVAVMALYTAM
jgi:hypothetical protein